MKIAFEMPSDRAVPLAVNRGTPAVLAEAGCDFSRAVRSIAKGLLEAEQEKKRRRFGALAKA